MTTCSDCNRDYKNIKLHKKTKKHIKNQEKQYFKKQIQSFSTPILKSIKSFIPYEDIKYREYKNKYTKKELERLSTIMGRCFDKRMKKGDINEIITNKKLWIIEKFKEDYKMILYKILESIKDKKLNSFKNINDTLFISMWNYYEPETLKLNFIKIKLNTFLETRKYYLKRIKYANITSYTPIGLIEREIISKIIVDKVFLCQNE